MAIKSMFIDRMVANVPVCARTKNTEEKRERERGKSVCSGPTLPTHCYTLRNESTSWAGSSKAWPLARQNLSPPLISAHVVNHNGYGNGPAASLYWSWCVCYQKDFGIKRKPIKEAIFHFDYRNTLMADGGIVFQLKMKAVRWVAWESRNL